MKKLFIVFIIFAVVASAMTLSAFAASVSPIEHPGNDANTYVPPEGCIRTTLPDSDQIGTHDYNFNDFGQLDTSGTNTLTVVVDSTGSYTRVASWSWSGSYPLYAVIVKGGPAFNEYVYDGTATSDTDLVSPTNPSGLPANISHVSVVLCPEELPPPQPDVNNICCIVIICLLIIMLIILIDIKCTLCCRKRHCCDKTKTPDC